LVKDPSAQRVTFYIQPRYQYRQEGEPVVYNDHVLLYNSKYNAYLHVSEEFVFDQITKESAPSEYRPPSPKRRTNPAKIFKKLEANVSQNFYKWQVINFRQMKSEKEENQFLFAQDVIYLKHGETSGILCHDEQSAKRIGEPAYVRIYKGNDDADIITTNNLFEIEIHN